MAERFIKLADPHLAPSVLEAAPEREFSIVVFSAGWPEDMRRLITSLQKHCADHDYEVITVSNHSDELEEAVRDLASADERVRGIFFSQHVGYGGGVNAGIVQSLGKVVVVVDSSVEATGDFLEPIGRALEDPAVGLAGPWGLISPDLRHFDEETEGEVDAMQAYCMGFRRSDLSAVGLFDGKFKFYRNADVDYSMRWRDKGLRIMALPLPLTRHAHREWEALTEPDREKKSHDNFARFLRTWRDRQDLLTGRALPHSHDDH
jgi:cysteinyl-tRNA synthetase